MMDSTSLQNWADDLFNARQSNSPKPALKLDNVSSADAYQVQKKLIDRVGGEIAGYKAGLTNKAIQQKHGADEPAGGILLADTKIEIGAVISRQELITPRIETEIGFVIATDIEHPIELEDFTSKLSHWQPMIELVDMGFSSQPNLTDIIASNVVAGRFLQSDFRHDVSMANEATVSFYKDNELLHEGRATDALGDQIQTACWIVNHMLSRGNPVRSGYVLMTGALGVTHPGDPGSYRADYGEFGSIDFEIA